MIIAFKVQYSAEAVMQLERLDKNIAQRITKKIESTRENPHTKFKRLSGRQEYKLRIGDYRAIANLDDSRFIIFIMSIGHRKNIYERQ